MNIEKFRLGLILEQVGVEHWELAAYAAGYLANERRPVVEFASRTYSEVRDEVRSLGLPFSSREGTVSAHASSEKLGELLGQAIEVLQRFLSASPNFGFATRGSADEDDIEAELTEIENLLDLSSQGLSLDNVRIKVHEMKAARGREMQEIENIRQLLEAIQQELRQVER